MLLNNISIFVEPAFFQQLKLSNEIFILFVAASLIKLGQHCSVSLVPFPQVGAEGHVITAILYYQLNLSHIYKRWTSQI